MHGNLPRQQWLLRQTLPRGAIRLEYGASRMDEREEFGWVPHKFSHERLLFQLPKALCAVLIENGIDTNQNKSFRLSLRHQQAVERVAIQDHLRPKAACVHRATDSLAVLPKIFERCIEVGRHVRHRTPHVPQLSQGNLWCRHATGKSFSVMTNGSPGTQP